MKKNELLYGQVQGSEKFNWSRQDYERAIEVQQLVAMPGWKVLIAMFALQREGILCSNKSNRDNAVAGFGTIKKIEGFDLACNMAAKIVSEAEKRIKGERVRKENEKIVEEQNG